MLRKANEAAHAAGVGRQLIEDKEFHGDTIVIQGSEVANFGLCSYLGLGDDERVIEGALDATRRFGVSYSSSTAYTALGLYGDLTERLEAMLSAKVILAGTTTLGHLAALPVLVRQGDLVLVDGQAHASILVMTPILAGNGASVETVRHSDVGQIAERLEQVDGSRRVWFLTDGIFSMHGDSVPAEAVHQLLQQHPNFYVYCDDAHGFGWDGPHGIGNYLKRSGWHDRLVISAGMAKSFGTMGGLIATPNEDFYDIVRLTGSPLVFGGPIPPPILGAGIASADIHLSEEHAELQSELDERIRFVNRFCGEVGIPLSASDHTPLWFTELGSSRITFGAAERMRERGFYVNPAVFPVVPRGRGGIRFTVTRYNGLDQIADMLTALRDVRLEFVGETEIEIDLEAERVDDGEHTDQSRTRK
jgi:7-keto-8-aminopelargonate synthetase-like enzyme